MTGRRYITTARLATLKDELRPIDWSIVGDVARLNLASGEQIRRLHYPATETGRRMARLDLQRLEERGVLTRLGRQVGGKRSGSKGWVYGLGIAGKRLTSPRTSRPREPWTPGRYFLNHVLAVSELYVKLRESATSTAKLERFEAEPRCWRPFNGPGGSRLILKPDAYVVTASDDYLDSWFIEIDLATESSTRIVEKAKIYGLYWQSGREQATEGVFPIVLFIVPDDKRKQQLVDVLSRRPPDHWQLFQVVTNDAAAESMTTGQMINNNQQEEVNP